MIWYNRILALHSKWIIGVTIAISLIEMIISYHFKEMPDFSDPALVNSIKLYRKFSTFQNPKYFNIAEIHWDNKIILTRVSKPEERR